MGVDEVIVNDGETGLDAVAVVASIEEAHDEMATGIVVAVVEVVPTFESLADTRIGSVACYLVRN